MPQIHRLRTLCAGLGATALLLAPVAAGAADGHVTNAKADVSASGPSFVHDTAWSTLKTNVSAVNIPGTTLTAFVLTVTGVPDTARGRVLGAHVHTRACTANAADSGPHYVNPAGDPNKPLAAREVWLDLVTDATGRGASVSLIDWRIKKGDANSVVVHAEPTHPVTGAAGARLVCTTATFGD